MASANANHNKHHTYLILLPPFFPIWRVVAKLANWLLWGKECQPLLWQCLKTLLGSMEHTRKATIGICKCQSQQTSHIPDPPAPLFPIWRVVAKLANWLLWGKECQPLLWQCLKTMLGSMEHTRKAAVGICQCQSHQTSHIPDPRAPFFPYLEGFG